MTELATRAWHEGTYRTDPAQLAFVRSALRELLGDYPTALDAVQVASEFAANAVKHSAGSLFALRCEVYPDHVRITVEDQGRWVPPQRSGDDEPHGLDLVNAIAGPGNWGLMTTATSGHTRAWAYLYC
jgi:anti-sigma regulatory factor (Ser/Thr protein kinase)